MEKDVKADLWTRNMIHLFLGTHAQLIKMAPIMVELQKRGLDYNFVYSGQHREEFENLLTSFGLKRPDFVLYTGRDVTGIIQMLAWGLRLLFGYLFRKENIWRGDKRGIVLNHGDTVTTLIGSILARL